jgi:pyrroloquinoline-quinone synthase
MNSLVQRIDNVIEEQSLLKHKFYVMWNEGKLSIESLSGYSKEYFQLVKSVPSFVGAIMEKSPNNLRSKIEANQQEEYEHIEPWTKFAGALNVSKDILEDYQGLEKTRQAVSNLSTLMNSFVHGAAAMYALEQEIPKISLSKIDGLRKFYGVSDDDAIEYFRLHAEADIRHAALWRKILESIPARKEEDLVQIASKSVSAQNLLLDSCYEAYC